MKRKIVVSILLSAIAFIHATEQPQQDYIEKIEAVVDNVISEGVDEVEQLFDDKDSSQSTEPLSYEESVLQQIKENPAILAVLAQRQKAAANK
ncbi:MAG: hypothetical protein ACJAZS_000381 [Alteromonas naphthalenivorans]|jgi:hypothetical protein